MNNVYCVCTTPDVYPVYANHWENFPKEITWVSDITKDSSFNLGFNYTEKELRENLNFYGDVSKRHYWNSYGNRIYFFILIRTPSRGNSLFIFFNSPNIFLLRCIC